MPESGGDLDAIDPIPEFDEYLTEIRGTIFIDDNKISPEAKIAFWNYMHHRGNEGKNDPKALDFAKEFEELTGLNLSDLWEYRCQLNGEEIPD